MPAINVYSNMYLQFRLAKVLRIQLGADLRYFTSYYAPDYYGAVGMFAIQDDSHTRVKIGNYPYLDLFVSAKWKRMRILLKYQHLNKNLFGNGEAFQIARYPLNPGMFKFGISWAFYD